MQFALSYLLGLPLKRHDRRSQVDGPLPLLEAFNLPGNQRFGVHRFAAALFHVSRSHLLQIVDVINKHPVQFVHGRINVSRHCDIDEEHRPVAPTMQKGLSMLRTEDVMRSASGADHNVSTAGCLIEFLERNDLGNHRALKFLSHAACPFVRTVRHQDCVRSLLHQVPRRKLAHLSRTNKEDRFPLQRSEDLPCQIHGD